MTIHKPTIFYIYGVLVGIIAAKCGLWGILVVLAGFAVGVVLDVKTKQHDGWH